MEQIKHELCRQTISNLKKAYWLLRLINLLLKLPKFLVKRSWLRKLKQTVQDLRILADFTLELSYCGEPNEVKMLFDLNTDISELRSQ